jgi:hypothetical protein
MNDNLNIFEQALDKLAFRQPVPVEARRFALYNKRKVLELTLRQFGDYSFFYGLTLRIYFYTKRLGINLSVLQSKIVLLAIAAIVGGALYTAVMHSAGILQRDASVINNNSISPAYVKEDQTQVEPAIKYPAKKDGGFSKQLSNVKYRIGIEKFSGDIIDNTTLNNITDKISDQLINLKGADRIINLRKGKKDKNMNLLLSGNVEQLGSTYIITTKIIDIESTRVLFVSSEEIKNIDRINNVISNLATKTAEQFE